MVAYRDVSASLSLRSHQRNRDIKIAVILGLAPVQRTRSCSINQCDSITIRNIIHQGKVTKKFLLQDFLHIKSN